MPQCTPADEEEPERPRTADSAPALAARAEERRPLRADDALHRRAADAAGLAIAAVHEVLLLEVAGLAVAAHEAGL